jgi:hypothetical protein
MHSLVAVRVGSMKNAVLLRLTYEQSIEFWKMYYCTDREKRIEKFINKMELT